MKTKEEKAKEYAENKSSADVFRMAHEKDFLAGYNQALQDSKVTEMLEMLQNLIEWDLFDLEKGEPTESYYQLLNATEILIKKINN